MRRRALLMGGFKVREEDAYIFEIDTRNTATGTTSSNQFQLNVPILVSESECRYVVDFGDGTGLTQINGKSDPNLLHNYSTAGIYTVKIYPRRASSQYIVYLTQANTGTFEYDFKNKVIKVMQYGFSVQANYRDCVGLTHIWASGQPTLYNNNCQDEYRGCSSLVHIEDLSIWDVSSVTNMSTMFSGCSSFNSDLSIWDVSSVTNMSTMFSGCSSFNSDLSTWDVSSVTSMARMFNGCSSFNSDLSTWDVSSVTNMSTMFSGCSSFNSDLSTWDVSSVTSMARMFNGCSSFNSDLSIWDVSSVTNMSTMFSGCSSFNSDLSIWDVSSVTNMAYMFNGCSSFNSDLSIWDVSSVTNMSTMFSGCSSFNSDLSIWDVSSVTNMAYMFNGCSSFNSDLSTWDVSSVLNFGLFMWYANVPATRVIDFSQWDFNKNVNFGNFIQFQAGTRVFNKPEMDILLQKLATAVIGTGRTETTKTLDMYIQNYGAAGKPYADALIADGWTLNYSNYEP